MKVALGGTGRLVRQCMCQPGIHRNPHGSHNYGTRANPERAIIDRVILWDESVGCAEFNGEGCGFLSMRGLRCCFLATGCAGNATVEAGAMHNGICLFVSARGNVSSG